MIELRVTIPDFIGAPLTWRRSLLHFAGLVLILALLWVVWGATQPAAAQEPFAEPPVGTRTLLPILSFVGTDATTQTLIQVQNVGEDFTRAIMLTWGEPGACGPQCVGPFKVECTGVLKPGSTWIFVESQVPQGTKSAIVYTFPQVQILTDDGRRVSVADEFCERLFEEVVFDCDAFRRFDLAFRAGQDFLGLPTTGGQPVAIDVLRLGQGDPTPELLVSGSYSGVTGVDQGRRDPLFGGFAYYAPIVYANAAGLNSWLYIQNSGVGCTTVEMWFQEQNDCLDAQICELFTLAPGETAQFNVSECVGPNFVGSVWIRTSQPTGIVVDHVGQDILMTDKAVPAQNPIFQTGSQVLFGPLIYREFQGWQTSLTVQNLSGSQFATVKVYFYDQSGNVITTLVDWICPRGSQTFFLPVINGLPGRFVGAVRVESLTTLRQGDFVPIAGVAHLIKYADQTASLPLEAVSYNLFSEDQSFDWQLGPGKASVIGIPSVLKGQAGLTTEIAIQNVNPNPGFTDFAIYLYDSNGLIEVICQKLSQLNVEYININSWGFINPGFAGSAVISAVFSNQVGGAALSAVSVDRVQSVLQFDVPGDESSGREAFPIFGAFDFEGPRPADCPGVGAGRDGEDVCTRTVIVQVTENGTAFGTPVAGALVQLRTAAGGQAASGVPIATGTTDSNGLAVLTDVRVPTPFVTTYNIFVAPPGSDKLERVGVTPPLGCPPLLLVPVVVPPAPLTFNIAGTLLVDDHNANCDADPEEARLTGVTVVLQDDNGDEVARTEVDSAGDFSFEDVEEGFYELKVLLQSGAGSTVSFLSPRFFLDGDYDTAPEQPNFLTDGDPDTSGTPATNERWQEPGCTDVDGP